MVEAKRGENHGQYGVFKAKDTAQGYDCCLIELVTKARIAIDIKNPRPSLVAQLVKDPPITWESWVQSLGWEDRLEKGMATHSSILAWRILWTV